MKLCLSIAMVLAATAGTARADEPATTTCYAGDIKATVLGATKTERGVVERKLNPAKHAITETVWTPGKEKRMEADVDVKANTFAWKAEDGKSGTGTLVGPPWHWTAQALVYDKGDLHLAIDSTRTGTTVTTKGTFTKSGKPIGGEAATFTMFDCAKLAAQRAAIK